jgi:hypothetical protein
MGETTSFRESTFSARLMRNKPSHWILPHRAQFELERTIHSLHSPSNSQVTSDPEGSIHSGKYPILRYMAASQKLHKNSIGTSHLFFSRFVLCCRTQEQIVSGWRTQPNLGQKRTIKGERQNALAK